MARFWAVQDAGVEAVLQRYTLAPDGSSVTADTSPIPLGFTGRGITAMAVHRANADLVYLADDLLNLYKWDGGTLTTVYTGSTAHTGWGINSIYIEDLDQRRVWFTIGDYRDTATHGLVGTQWVFRTTDGTNFTATVGQPPLTTHTDYPHVARVLVAEVPTRLIYAVCNWTLPSAGGGTMAFTSVDEGTTWQAISPAFDPVPTQKEFVDGWLVPYGRSDGTLFVSCFQLATLDHNIRTWPTGSSVMDSDSGADGGYGGALSDNPLLAITLSQMGTNENADYTTDGWATSAMKNWVGTSQSAGKGKAQFSAMVSEPVALGVTSTGVLRASVNDAVTWGSPGLNNLEGVVLVAGGYTPPVVTVQTTSFLSVVRHSRRPLQ